MKIKHNGCLRSGRKAYRMFSDHKNKTATHLEENPAEIVKLSFNGGRISQDQGTYGTWRISERYNLQNNQTYKNFEDAAAEFEKRTGETPPTPEWRTKQ